MRKMWKKYLVYLLFIFSLFIFFSPNAIVNAASNTQPVTQKYNQYVTVTSKNYHSFSKINGALLLKNPSLFQQTFVTRERVTDSNGEAYLTLYDNQGKFRGYLNQKAVQVAKGPEGVHIKHQETVTVKIKGYNSFNNFQWKIRNINSKILNRTFKVTGRYQHFNGSTYYSLYDNKNQWHGYINANGVRRAEVAKVVPKAVAKTVAKPAAKPAPTTVQKSASQENVLREAEKLFLKKLAVTRQQARVRSLAEHQKLNDVAKIRAIDIQKSFEHKRPNGQNWQSLVDKNFAKGYYGFGENIVYSKEYQNRSAEYIATTFHNAFIKSYGHYDNMIFNDYVVTGVAFSYREVGKVKYYYGVNTFGAK